jgi:hypothetical protein
MAPCALVALQICHCQRRGPGADPVVLLLCEWPLAGVCLRAWMPVCRHVGQRFPHPAKGGPVVPKQACDHCRNALLRHWDGHCLAVYWVARFCSPRSVVRWQQVLRMWGVFRSEEHPRVCGAVPLPHLQLPAARCVPRSACFCLRVGWTSSWYRAVRDVLQCGLSWRVG